MGSHVFLGNDPLDDKLCGVFGRDEHDDEAPVEASGAPASDLASRHAVDPHPVVRQERGQGLPHFVHDVTRRVSGPVVRVVEGWLHRLAADGGGVAHQAGEGVTDAVAGGKADAGSAGSHQPPQNRPFHPLVCLGWLLFH